MLSSNHNYFMETKVVAPKIMAKDSYMSFQMILKFLKEILIMISIRDIRISKFCHQILRLMVELRVMSTMREVLRLPLQRNKILLQSPASTKKESISQRACVDNVTTKSTTTPKVKNDDYKIIFTKNPNIHVSLLSDTHI